MSTKIFPRFGQRKFLTVYQQFFFTPSFPMPLKIKTNLEITHSPRPDLNGALFAERSGAKKREWKAEKGAQKQFRKWFKGG